MCAELLYKAFATAGVCIAAIHKTMDINLIKTIFLCYITKSEKVVKRRVYATVTCKAHEMNCLSIVTGIGKRTLDFRIFQN